MIHLNYKCKVNVVKLPFIWIDLCLKLIFENTTTGRNRLPLSRELRESGGKNNAGNAEDKPPSWVHHLPAGSLRRGSHEGVYGN